MSFPQHNIIQTSKTASLVIICGVLGITHLEHFPRRLVFFIFSFLFDVSDLFLDFSIHCSPLSFPQKAGISNIYKHASLRNHVLLSVSQSIKVVEGSINQIETFIENYLVDHFSDSVTPRHAGWIDSYYHFLFPGAEREGEGIEEGEGGGRVEWWKSVFSMKGRGIGGGGEGGKMRAWADLPLGRSSLLHIHNELRRLEELILRVLRTYESGRPTDVLVLAESLVYASEMFKYYTEGMLEEAQVRRGKDFFLG